MSWHDCEDCGQACYCDGDDTALPVDPREGCRHQCQPDEFDGQEETEAEDGP